MTGTADLLHVGRIGRPHGLGGAFHVTKPRSRVLDHAGELIIDGRSRRVLRRGGTSQRPVLSIDGVRSREDVDAIRGSDLFVPRADAPVLDDDEWYAEDLEGLAVVDGGDAVGTVARLLAYPSCDLLEVETGDGVLLVPLIDDAVRSVDLDARTVDVDRAFLGGEDEDKQGVE